MAKGAQVQYIRFAVDGSAARKMEKAPTPFKKLTLPKVRKRKSVCICIDPVAIFGICVAVCMFIVMAAGLHQYAKQQEKVARMQAYVEELRAENDALEQTYMESYDAAEVERTALALGMVPKAQAETVSLEVPAPAQQESVTIWERIGTFLTSIFA